MWVNAGRGGYIPVNAGLGPARVKAQEPGQQNEHRLQIDRSGPFLASPLFENTVFLPHSRAMGLQIGQKLSSLGSLFAVMPSAAQTPSPQPAGAQRVAGLGRQWPRR